MGALLPNLRAAMASSARPDECLIERRSRGRPFPESYSPHFVDQLLRYAKYPHWGSNPGLATAHARLLPASLSDSSAVRPPVWEA